MTYYKVNNYIDFYKNLSKISNTNYLSGRAADTFNTEYKMNNIISCLSIKKNSKVLDIGCGNALLLRKLAKQKKNLKLTGTLSSNEEVKVVKKIIKKEKLNKKILIKKLDLLSKNYNLKKSYFDYIIINGVIQYIDKCNYSNIISKLNKLIKLKGILFFGEVHTKNLMKDKRYTTLFGWIINLLKSNSKKRIFYKIKQLILSFFNKKIYIFNSAKLKYIKKKEFTKLLSLTFARIRCLEHYYLDLPYNNPTKDKNLFDFICTKK